MRTEVFLDSAFAAVVPCLRTGAVREVEAWLLADAARLGRFLGVPAARIPLSPDTLRNPKQEMVTWPGVPVRAAFGRTWYPDPKVGARSARRTRLG